MNIEEKMLEERLENWGRWCQDKSARQGRSAIAKFADAVPNEDEPSADPEEPREHLKPINVDDALLVQRAWHHLPTSPESCRKAKMVLGVVYCYSNDYAEILYTLKKYHRINLREREFNSLLDTGKKMISNLIARMEPC